ncbi:DUF3182 family protein [Halopseudomonas pelagia]|uniref:DUF3182 family protein n=1 Tax=Halopseudomonas pelagia TaxID=553151 RepID=A0AA91U3P3_9GAMM|nr:DUF3182 family protein [Halopseudomonas pelagia]PCC99868.1 hypothetical protein CO192_08600 [Halopseudomonas pelagia]QFY56270.1 DUF3182 family protein [Halopseudomonas pelagia]
MNDRTGQKHAGVRLMPAADTSEHETAVHVHLAQRIATMLGVEYQGTSSNGKNAAYVIPADTLVGDQAHSFGLHAESDFFGGSVPFPFMATKTIVHPLISSPRVEPEGWSTELIKLADKSVLRGFSAFSREDALDAGADLLLAGPVRVKPTRAKAGRGQLVVRNESQLREAVLNMDAAELQTWGLALEENLEDVTTFSVGQVRLAGLTASYYGWQNLTEDNQGSQVYGGSDLHMVRGDYAQLFQLPNLSQEVMLAISQAQLFDHAVSQTYPGIIASRRNYDVAQGLHAIGHRVSGVLEQSWRIGGASSAEIFALERLIQQPALTHVSASSIERFGKDMLVPDDVFVLYKGEDPEFGFLTKGVRMNAHDS